MHIPRLFFTADDLAAGGAATGKRAFEPSLDLQPGLSVEITNKSMRNQLINVLRLTPGNKIVLLDGRGLAFECVLEEASNHTAQCTVLSREVLPAGGLKVSVGLSLLKGDRFDWALQKLTELGAFAITPLITSRSVVKIDTNDAKGVQQKLSRWQAIVREAAEQSERATIPQVVKPQRCEVWITEIAAGGTCDTVFMCAERIKGAHLRDILRPKTSQKENLQATTGKTIYLVVGPEGGFTPEEIAFAQKLGVKPVSLGERILRSETAAIYALAQVLWCLEK